MKILVEHDASGAIRSIITPAGARKDGTRIEFQPRPGCVITEIEARHITDGHDPKELHDQLYALRTEYRIEAHKRLVAITRQAPQ